MLIRLGRAITTAGRDVLILIYLTIAVSPLSFYLTRSSSRIWDLNWGAWIKTFQQQGLVNGFYAVNDVYPPLTFSFLAALSLIKGDTYLYFKCAQLIATFLSALIVLMWCRNVLIAVGLFIALTPNSIIFDSMDIFYTPFLLGALIAASARQWTCFSALYMAAMLIKFQPVVLAPLLLIWAVSELRSFWTWVRLIVPACLVVLPVVIIFGPQFPGALLKALGASMFFSGNAYNLNWLTGSLYGFLNWPDASASSVMPMMTDPRLPKAMWVLSKYLSFGSYAFIILLFVFARRDKKDLFLFCAFAMLSYFMLHSEVHENHLHIVVICMAMLVAVTPAYSASFVFWSGAQAVNLMLIFDGWPRTIAGLDVTLLIALANVIMFAAFYVDTTRTVVVAWNEDRRDVIAQSVV